MPADRLTITAIVPTYNRAAYLPEALEGILGQTLPPDQVIVVDDGSTEDIASIVRRYGTQATYIRQENAGKSAALNRGLALAEGDAIWVFDDDDVPLPDALERLAAALTAAPEAGFAYGRHDYLVRAGEDWVVEAVADANPSGEALNVAMLHQCLIHQPGMLVLARCLHAVGPFDETLFRSQDYDMMLRLARRFAGVKVDGVVFHQRKHDGQRGPAREQRSASRKAEMWGKYDRLIFERIYTTYALDEFLPATSHFRLKDEVGLALATRAAVMARRALWDRAAADLKALGAHLVDTSRSALNASERRSLAAVFDWAGHGLQSLGEATPFFAALRALPAGVRRSACAALAQPLARRFRIAVRRRRLREARAAVSAGLNLGSAWLGVGG